MEITVRIRRAIVIDDDVHSFYINATTENISGNQNTLLEGLEGGVSLDTMGH